MIKNRLHLFFFAFSSLSAYGTYLIFNIKLHEPPKPPTIIEIVELPEEKRKLRNRSNLKTDYKRS
jgi:hypothetical protein